MAVMLPLTAVYGKKKDKSNIMVWGEVVTADDGYDYLTMYKNCPAEVTAQFHFKYKDKTYQFIVNGQSGKVGGNYPISPWRVALAVLICIFIVMVLYWLTQ